MTGNVRQKEAVSIFKVIPLCGPQGSWQKSKTLNDSHWDKPIDWSYDSHMIVVIKVIL